MNLTCSRCGGPICRQDGPGGRRRYCQRCSPPRDRKDRPRKRPLKPATPAQVPTIGDTTSITDVTSATVKELADLGVPEDNWLAVLALNLAHHIDRSDGETAAGLIALIREHEATLNDIRTRGALGTYFPHGGNK